MSAAACAELLILPLPTTNHGLGYSYYHMLTAVTKISVTKWSLVIPTRHPRTARCGIFVYLLLLELITPDRTSRYPLLLLQLPPYLCTYVLLATCLQHRFGTSHLFAVDEQPWHTNGHL